ncbi:MAG: OmpA family protein [Oceanococcus sp.]
MGNLPSKLLTGALLSAAVAAPASAANYDSRLYVAPSVNFMVTDPGRGEDSTLGYGLTVGMPVSESRNYELTLGYADPGNSELIDLSASLLTFFDKDAGLFSVLSLGALNVDGGAGDDYYSGTLSAGLGALIPAFMGEVRIEALLRGDLHFNESAGLGGKKAFVEPIFRLGYQIPLGPEPQIDAPAGSDVAVVAPSGSDSDADGVGDSADLCPGTMLGTVVDATGCATSSTGALEGADCRQPKLDEAVDEYGCAVDRSVILNGVNFEFDSDVLTSKAEAVLDDVAQVLTGMPNATIEIAGHTSDEGDEYYNIDLSQRRSAAVRTYLVNAGVPAEQLKAKGYGGKAPLQENDTATGRRENRRVEVKIVQ